MPHLSLQALIDILQKKDMGRDPENVMGYLRPFRIIISLLDKPEIGTVSSFESTNRTLWCISSLPKACLTVTTTMFSAQVLWY